MPWYSPRYRSEPKIGIPVRHRSSVPVKKLTRPESASPPSTRTRGSVSSNRIRKAPDPGPWNATSPARNNAVKPEPLAMKRTSALVCPWFGMKKSGTSRFPVPSGAPAGAATAPANAKLTHATAVIRIGVRRVNRRDPAATLEFRSGCRCSLGPARPRGGILEPAHARKGRLRKRPIIFPRPMIARHWRGWTAPHNAAAYERLLNEKVFPSLRRIEGYVGACLLRRDAADEVEFVVINFFESLDAVQRFAGPN